MGFGIRHSGFGIRVVGRARVGLFVLRECDVGFAGAMLACSAGWGVVSLHAHAFVVEL